MPSIVLLHRREDLYPDDAVFRPDRFLDDSAEAPTWIPFGGGLRRCLGAALATLELDVVLRTLLTRMQQEAADKRRRGRAGAPSRSSREPVPGLSVDPLSAADM